MTKFVHLECLVPASSMKAAMQFFDEHRIWAKPITDTQTATAAKSNGGHSRRSSVDYQAWIAKNVNEQMPLSDIREMWKKDGLDVKRIYSALATAVKNKVIKKMAKGMYKPGSAA